MLSTTVTSVQIHGLVIPLENFPEARPEKEVPFIIIVIIIIIITIIK
jgi:hypothetical protein